MVATIDAQPVTRDEVRINSFLAGLNNQLFVQVTYEPLNLVVTSTNERDESAAVAACLELITRMQSERRLRVGRGACAQP
ncbi:MAG TPA: hypothetical protein VF201_15800 [Nitrolancea sp.]